MPLAILARRIALLIFAALYPALAFGLDQTYVGMLLPDNRDPPIPIVVELREAGSSLIGSVKTSPPLKGDAPIESGDNVFGNCSVNVALSRTVRIILWGRCEQTTFQGTYTIFDAQRRTESTGRFRLAHKATEAVTPDSSQGAAPSTDSMAACLKSNTQCLTACPRGDESGELMCTSRCRAKFRTCKGNVTKLPGEAG